ncbi:MAG: maleylpyruvate isomerase family mycothiol-dependent enzyme [Marmoricola sp.]
MDKQQIFAACTQMRRDTADWLEGLTPEQLDTQSLCSEWAVRGVAGHLIGSVSLPMAALLWRTACSGFNPHRANVSLGNELGARSGPEIATDLRSHAGAELTVPFVGAHGPFTDLLVHNADMRVPLKEPWQPEVELSVESLAFLAKGAVGFTSRKRLAGLRLVATDARFTAGEGEEIRGPALHLVLAVCGRAVGLETLEGAGRDVLAGRL